ncbi:hypothetical protein [Xanthobacter sp. YC-JY1]|uniref:hypothetical protein n=1 Tax=Xanthobacter sp. YC-JY1 TaxID=2419844 RepID=UPI00352DEF14|nr:hypothetical protein D7006_17480 [Xanthobacter sp. YC-JY1]
MAGRRDIIAELRARDFIAAGTCSPQPAASYSYVTTRAFLAHFGFDTLRDLPDMMALEEVGLLAGASCPSSLRSKRRRVTLRLTSPMIRLKRMRSETEAANGHRQKYHLSLV